MLGQFPFNFALIYHNFIMNQFKPFYLQIYWTIYVLYPCDRPLLLMESLLPLVCHVPCHTTW